jgi:L-cystine transport system permease protein
VSFDLAFGIKSIPQIASGIPLTLLITAVSLLLGLAAGFFIALARIYKVPVLDTLARLFVSCVRGVPAVVALYLVYHWVPLFVIALNNKFKLGIPVQHVPALLYALITFAIYMAAYLSEMIRSALGVVNRGQLEAAYSVGLSRAQAFRRIVIPQAAVVALPFFANNFMAVLKGSSIVSFIGVMELMGMAKTAAAEGFNFIEAYAVAAVLYWILGITAEKIFKYAETRIKFRESLIKSV